MFGIGWLSTTRSEEHTSELQSHRDLHSFPTRRSSDLPMRIRLVTEATWPIMISGDVLATLGMLWCSASQYRTYPSRSAALAKSKVLISASDRLGYVRYWLAEHHKIGRAHV